MNLVCRDSQLRDEVVSNVKGVFSELYSYKVEDEVNEIIYAFNSNSVSRPDNDQFRIFFGEKLKSFNEIIKTNSSKNSREFIDVENMLKAFKLLH